MEAEGALAAKIARRLTSSRQPMVDDDLSPDQARRSYGAALISLLIIAPAASPALTLWASNPAQVPKAYRLLLVVGGFALLGLATFWILRRLFSDSRMGGLMTFLVLFALTSGGRFMAEQNWGVRWIGVLGGIGVVAAIVYRLRDLWFPDAVVVASAVAILVPPLMSGIWVSVANAEPDSPTPAWVPTPAMVERPDIFLVIVDGYTSLPVLREFFEFEDLSLKTDLSRLGFEVAEPAFSPYPMTHLAVSSLLELDYITEDAPRIAIKDGRSLEQVIGGDSYLVDLLAQNGYRITMVESGWHMSTCGEHIDVCVANRFIDEGVGVVLSQSLLWPLIEPSVGSGFTHGARHAMDWSVDNIGRLVNNGTPDFAFIHVLAPHPPLLLDASCGVVPDRRLAGMAALKVVGVESEVARARLAGYVSQVQCINQFVLDLADAIADSDALVLVTGDHGSDAMSQLETLPEQWSDFQVLERMSVFVAAKTPPRCEEVSSLVTVVLFRMLVSCAGDLGLQPIDEKSYLFSLDGSQPSFMRTLDAEEVARLAVCLGQLDETSQC
jgi:hypothetical protein